MTTPILQVPPESQAEQYEDMAEEDAIPALTNYFKGEINDDQFQQGDW